LQFVANRRREIFGFISGRQATARGDYDFEGGMIVMRAENYQVGEQTRAGWPGDDAEPRLGPTRC